MEERLAQLEAKLKKLAEAVERLAQLHLEQAKFNDYVMGLLKSDDNKE